jgi:hypothetical protein
MLSDAAAESMVTFVQTEMGGEGVLEADMAAEGEAWEDATREQIGMAIGFLTLGKRLLKLAETRQADVAPAIELVVSQFRYPDLDETSPETVAQADPKELLVEVLEPAVRWFSEFKSRYLLTESPDLGIAVGAIAVGRVLIATTRSLSWRQVAESFSDDLGAAD